MGGTKAQTKKHLIGCFTLGIPSRTLYLGDNHRMWIRDRKIFYWQQISEVIVWAALNWHWAPCSIRLLMRRLRYLVLSCRPFPFNSLSVQRNAYDLIDFGTWIKLLIIFIEIHVTLLRKNKKRDFFFFV